MTAKVVADFVQKPDIDGVVASEIKPDFASLVDTINQAIIPSEEAA